MSVSREYIHINDLANKSAIGNGGEEWCCQYLDCPNCHSTPTWMNLNTKKKNYPGIDLLCRQCHKVIQVKTGASALTYCGRGWRFPTSENTVRETISLHEGNIRYVYIQYDRYSSVAQKYAILSVTWTNPLRMSSIDAFNKCIYTKIAYHFSLQPAKGAGRRLRAATRNT